MIDSSTSDARDACHSIRGYVYQAKFTLLSWVRLPPEREILCECGEDLAEVACAMASEEPNQLIPLILNQLKYSEKKNITLRTHGVLEAFANCLELISQEPEALPAFRYVTNAQRGNEQQVEFPRRLCGLDALDALNSGDLKAEEIDVVISQYRVVIESVEPWQKTESARERFGRLKAFVRDSDDSDLIRFLKCFDWATGFANFVEINTLIETELVTRGFETLHSARGTAERLLVEVLETLSTTGEKRLGHNRLLSCLGRVRDSEQIRRIEANLKLDQLILFAEEARVTGNKLLQSTSRLDQLVTEIHQGFFSQLPHPDEPLPPPAFIIKRETVHAGSSVTWLHFSGVVGHGKTQFLAQLAQNRDFLWLRLGTLGAERKKLILEEKLVVAAALRLNEVSWWPVWKRFGTPWDAILSRLIRSVSNLYIILDDIPELVGDEEFLDFLVGFCRWCAGNNVQILSSGLRPLHSRILNECSGICESVPIPGVQAGELRDALEFHGCPTEQIPGLLNLIDTVSGGSATVASILLGRLKTEDFRVHDQVLAEVLEGSSFNNLQEETLGRLAQMLQDGERELLYRVTCLKRGFFQDEVPVIAEVEPAIRLPMEKFVRLLGGWVELNTQLRYRVTPLLATGSRKLVDAKAERAIHQRLADHILKDAAPHDRGIDAAIHCWESENYLRIVDIFDALECKLKTLNEAKSILSLTFLFRPGWWPREFNPEHCLAVRFFQIRAIRLSDEPHPYLAAYEEELDELLALEARSNGFQTRQFYAAFNSSLLAGSPARSVRRAYRSLRLLEKMPKISSLFKSLLATSGITIRTVEEYVLVPLTRSTGAREVVDGVRAFFKVSSDIREEIITGPFAFECAQAIASACYLRPLLTETQSDVHQALLEISNMASKEGWPALESAAFRTAAIVLADDLGRSEEALAALDRLVGDTEENAWLAAYTRACITYEHKGEVEAYPYFVEIIRRQVPDAGYVFFTSFDAYCRAHVGLRKAGRLEEAITLGKEGLQKALLADDIWKPKPGVSVVWFLNLTCETAYASWEAGDISEAFTLFSKALRAYRKFGIVKEPGQDQFLRKYSNALHWLTLLRSKPAHAEAWAEMTTPFPGYFYRSFPRIAELAPPPLSTVFLFLGTACAAYGSHDLAVSALEDGLSIASTQGLNWFKVFLYADLANVTALQGDVDKCLKATVESFNVIQPGLMHINPGDYRGAVEPFSSRSTEDQEIAEINRVRNALVVFFIGAKRRGAVDLSVLKLGLQSSNLRLSTTWERALRLMEWGLEERPWLEIKEAAMVFAQDQALYAICCIAFPHSVGQPIERSIQMHASGLASVLRTEGTNLAAIEFAKHIIEFWSHWIERQSLYPRHVLAAVKDTPKDLRRIDVVGVARKLITDISLACSREIHQECVRLLR